jgi:pantetheine-phosphate adenylyltransferase
MTSFIKRAIFPGSFDPFTLGHLDILERGANIFDEIIIGVLNNPDKVSMFSVEDRISLIKEILPKSENCRFVVQDFQGLLVDFAKKTSIFNVLRGIRTIADYEYERQMALMNNKLEPKFETIFLIANPNYSYISSSLVKQIYNLGGDISALVPKLVVEKLKK